MMIDITVDRNYVKVLGHKIDRPSSMFPSQWLEFWENSVDAQDDPGPEVRDATQ